MHDLCFLLKYRKIAQESKIKADLETSILLPQLTDSFIIKITGKNTSNHFFLPVQRKKKEENQNIPLVCLLPTRPGISSEREEEASKVSG